MTSSINFIQYVIILLEKTLILVWMSVAGRDVHPRVAKLWTILAQYCLRTRPKLGPILDTPWAMPWVTTTLAQARTACANNIGPSLVLPGIPKQDRQKGGSGGTEEPGRPKTLFLIFFFIFFLGGGGAIYFMR